MREGGCQEGKGGKDVKGKGGKDVKGKGDGEERGLRKEGREGDVEGKGEDVEGNGSVNGKGDGGVVSIIPACG